MVNAVLTLLGLGLCFPLPLLALLGVMGQRRALVQERRRFAHLKRLSNGRIWR